MYCGEEHETPTGSGTVESQAIFVPSLVCHRVYTEIGLFPIHSTKQVQQLLGVGVGDDEWS